MRPRAHHLSAIEAVTLAVCERRGYAGSWWQKLPAYGDAIEEAYAILLSRGPRSVIAIYRYAAGNPHFAGFSVDRRPAG